MDTNSKKRKRDEDRPRITYYASGRTFERLFKEESLTEAKTVVRRKLGLPDNAKILLAQLRGDQVIDLDDDDDFEAFSALAYSTMAMSVRVQVQEPIGTAINPNVPSISQPALHQSTPDGPQQPPAASHDTMDIDVNITKTNETRLDAQGNQPPENQVTTKTKRKKSITGKAATATDEIHRPQAKRRRKNTVIDRVETNPEAGPPPAKSLPLNDASTSPEVQSVAAPTGSPPMKKTKRKKSEVQTSETVAAALDSIATGSAGTSENKVTKRKTSRKSLANAEEPPNPAISSVIPSASNIVISNATTADAPSDPSKKAKRVIKRKTKTNPAEPATDKSNLRDGNNEQLQTSEGSVLKIVSSAPAKKLTNEAEAIGKASLPHSEVTKESASIHPHLVEQGLLELPVTDLAPKPSDSATGHDKEPAVHDENDPRTISASEAQIKKRRLSDKHKCPLCYDSFHLKWKCPVVTAGVRSIENRLQELRQEDSTPSLIAEVEGILAKAKAQDTPSEDVESQTHAKIQAANKLSAKAQAHLSPNNPLSANKSVRSSAVYTKDATKSTQQKNRTRDHSADINITNPPAGVDLATVDIDALIRGPVPEQLSIDNLVLPSDSGDEDSEQGAILEEDSDYDRQSRFRQRGRRASYSSSDEGEDNRAIDINSSRSNSPNEMAFKTIDRLGQSIELDKNPDHALSGPSTPGGAIPDTTTEAEDTTSKKSPDPNIPRVISKQKPSTPGVNSNGASFPSADQSMLQRSPMACGDPPLATEGISQGQKSLKGSYVKPSSQARMIGSPKTVHTMKNRHGQLPAHIRDDRASGNTGTPKATQLHPTPRPEPPVGAGRGKGGAAKGGSKIQTRTTKIGQKTPNAVRKKGLTNGDVVHDVHEPPHGSSPPHTAPPDVSQEHSLAQWETLRPSSSPVPEPSQTLDELETQESSPLLVTSTPLAVSSIPFASLNQGSKPTNRSPAESDDEEEVEHAVKAAHSRQSSTTAYRRLTDLTSQALFAPPPLVRPPRFSHKGNKEDKAALYGLSQKEEEEESSSGSDSDSDSVAASHIPLSKRAGFSQKR